MVSFTFGRCSFFLIIPLVLSPLFSCIQSYFIGNSEFFSTHPMIITFMMFFGETIGGSFQIFYILQGKKLKQTKSKNSKENKENRGIIVSFEKGFGIYLSKEKKIKALLLLVSVAFIDFIGSFGLASLGTQSSEGNIVDFQSETRILQIFFLIYLSKAFLSITLKKHQIFGIVFLFAGIIILILEDFLTKKGFSFFLLFMYSFFYLLYCFQDIIEKKIMEHSSLFHILLIEGSIGMSLTFLSLLICYFLRFKFKFCQNQVKDLSELYKENLLYFFIILIGQIGFSISVLLTNFHYQPCQINISDTMSFIFLKIILLITGGVDSINLAYEVPAMILLILGCLIYNEIIIFGFWGLEADTKDEINRRSANEILLINEELNKAREEEEQNISNNLSKVDL